MMYPLTPPDMPRRFKRWPMRDALDAHRLIDWARFDGTPPEDVVALAALIRSELVPGRWMTTQRDVLALLSWGFELRVPLLGRRHHAYVWHYGLRVGTCPWVRDAVVIGLLRRRKIEPFLTVTDGGVEYKCYEEA